MRLPCWSQPRWKICTNRTSRSASRRASSAQRAKLPGVWTSGPYMSRTCLGSLEMSASSGTDVCIRNAISYWAIRAWVSGSANDSYSLWLSRLIASSVRRRVDASTPVGVRQEQDRIARRPQGDALVLAGQEPRAPEPVVDRLGFLPARTTSPSSPRTPAGSGSSRPGRSSATNRGWRGRGAGCRCRCR